MQAEGPVEGREAGGGQGGDGGQPQRQGAHRPVPTEVRIRKTGLCLDHCTVYSTVQCTVQCSVQLTAVQ